MSFNPFYPTSGSITTFTGTTISTTNLYGTAATFGSFTSPSGTVTTLTSTNATITSLSGTTENYTSGTIGTLTLTNPLGFASGGANSITQSGLGANANPLFDEPTGTIARTIARGVQANALGLTSNSPSARIISLTAGMVAGTIASSIGNVGGTGVTHYWHALVDNSANHVVLATTADTPGNGTITASTWKPLALTTPYTVPTTGTYYIVTGTTASGGAPTLAGQSLTSNVWNTATPILSGTLATTAGGSQPTIGGSLGTITATNAASYNFGHWIIGTTS